MMIFRRNPPAFTGNTVAEPYGMRLLTLSLMAAAFVVTASVADAGQARQRWPDSSSSQGGGGEAAPRTAVPRESPPPPPPAPRAEAPPPAPQPARPQGAPVRATTPAEGGQRTAQPRQRVPQPADSGRATGAVAVPRGSVPPPRPSGGSTVYSPAPRVYNNYNYYNYPRRYYPYGYGSFGLGYFYYDPYTWYPYDNYNYRFRGYGYGYPTGELRLQVRPRQAEVFVDGYFAGHVDDFDGIVQSLRLEEGPYSIELVAPGYEPIIFNVRIQPGRKITYRGDLRPVRP